MLGSRIDLNFQILILNPFCNLKRYFVVFGLIYQNTIGMGIETSTDFNVIATVSKCFRKHLKTVADRFENHFKELLKSHR